MLDKIVPPIRHQAMLLLGLLLLTTGVLLVAVFFLYFLAISRTLLDSRILSEWIGVEIDAVSTQLTILGTTQQIEVDSTFYPTVKVSLLLAIFVAATSIIYALTEDSFKETLTRWLSNKAKAWRAVGCMYLSATHPDYQIWETTRDDSRKGMINVAIVFPKNLAVENVEKASNTWIPG